MKSEIKSKRFFSFMCFLAIIFLVVALFINFLAVQLGSSGDGIFSQIANIIKRIAQMLCYVCALVTAYGYVRSKRSGVWLVIYIICCVLLTVLVILPFFGINI